MKIKLLTKTAKVPTRGSCKSAGFDLYNDAGQIIIGPHETIKVPTGVAVGIPEGYFGAIFARSGMSTKRGLRPANCTGVIDEDYRGELLVALHNDSDTSQLVEADERIAQLVILPYLAPSFEIVDELPTTARGEGGFGSTGNK